MAGIIELSEARRLVREFTPRNPVVTRTIDDAVGYFLAESIVSSLDSPAYDKSMVDGLALQAADIAAGRRRLRVVEQILAGALPQCTITSGTAARIMTGAPVPAGADAVVMVEQTRTVDGNGDGAGKGKIEQVEIEGESIHAGQNILRRATVLERGQPLMSVGHELRPVEIGLLADLGRERVDVFRRARVALVQTGDELVPAGATPGPAQIRNSNGPLLAALIRQAGGIVNDLGIVADETGRLRRAIDDGLMTDLLLLSGGVSQGVRDLVPSVLEAAGVECVFHKVRLKPGQPMWFGMRRTEHQVTLVFGLPGNPVSGLVCFLLFVAPALKAMAGSTQAWQLPWSTVRLTESITIRGVRPTFWPVALAQAEAVQSAGELHDPWHPDAASNEISEREEIDVVPLAWRGSADPFTLAHAAGFVYFPRGDCQYAAGARVRMLPLARSG
jgi:molybdopterin molybdotransferase